MYCPKCFNNTLQLNPRGVVNLIINGKQMDAGRFLFNTETTRKDQIESDLKVKLQEFFQWYATFKNREPITTVELCTFDFRCRSCSFMPSLNHRYSVIDILIPNQQLLKHLQELSLHYHMEIELKSAA
jgi:hypothetical protein